MLVRTAKLENGMGELVSFASMPAFATMPDVLIWGDLVFARQTPIMAIFVEDGVEQRCPIYRECFAYPVLDIGTPRSTVAGAKFPHELKVGESYTLPGGDRFGRISVREVRLTPGEDVTGTRLAQATGIPEADMLAMASGAALDAIGAERGLPRASADEPDGSYRHRLVDYLANRPGTKPNPATEGYDR